MKYWTWLDFRLFWWYVFSNGEGHLESLRTTPRYSQHFVFFLFTGSPAFFGPHWGPFCRHFKIRFKQRSLSSMLLGRISWDVRWLGDRNFMTLKIHIHIHPYPPISIQSSSYIEVTCMAMYLCIYVSMYLCIYLTSSSKPFSLVQFNQRWFYVERTQRWLRSWLLSLPACQPWQSSVKSWERGGGRRWEQYPSLVWQLVYDSSFIYGLTHVDTRIMP